MSKPKRASEGTPQEYPCSDCSLAALQQRSQLDFEIDFFERIINRDPTYVEVLARLGELFALKGWHRRALQADLRLAQLRPHDPLVLYNLACSHALLHQTEESVAALRRAVAAGYCDFEHLAHDKDLDPIRCSPDFLQFMKDLVASGSRTRYV